MPTNLLGGRQNGVRAKHPMTKDYVPRYPKYTQYFTLLIKSSLGSSLHRINYHVGKLRTLARGKLSCNRQIRSKSLKQSWVLHTWLLLLECSLLCACRCSDSPSGGTSGSSPRWTNGSLLLLLLAILLPLHTTLSH